MKNSQDDPIRSSKVLIIMCMMPILDPPEDSFYDSFGDEALIPIITNV
jgi:hypothetical protein